MITQAELRELQSLNGQIKHMTRLRDDLQQRVRVQLDAREPIEFGRLAAYTQVNYQRRFSLASVSAVVGSAEALQLRDRLANVPSVRLVVCEANGAVSATANLGIQN